MCWCYSSFMKFDHATNPIYIHKWYLISSQKHAYMICRNDSIIYAPYLDLTYIICRNDSIINTPYLDLTYVQNTIIILWRPRRVFIDVQLFSRNTTGKHDNILGTGTTVALVVHRGQRSQLVHVCYHFVDEDVVAVMANICGKKIFSIETYLLFICFVF